MGPAAPRSRPWSLKIHGDIEGSVVFSRDEFLGYDTLWRPLASVLQSAMLTKHVLFVGYSLMDENFVRLGRDVSYMLKRLGVSRMAGTVLTSKQDRVLGELWKGDLEPVAISTAPDAQTLDAARDLDFLLDRVATTAAKNENSYVLDSRYRTIIDKPDAEIATQLCEVGTQLRKLKSPVWTRLIDVLTEYGLNDD